MNQRQERKQSKQCKHIWFIRFQKSAKRVRAISSALRQPIFKANNLFGYEGAVANLMTELCYQQNDFTQLFFSTAMVAMFKALLSTHKFPGSSLTR